MDPIDALTTARTLDEAYALAGREQVEHAIRSCSWAIMAAPDLYLLLEEYYSLARLNASEAVLCATIREAQQAATDALCMGGEGFDPYPARASVTVKAVGEHTRLASTRLKLHDSLMRRIQHVIWRLTEIGKRPMSAAAIRAMVMGYVANTDPKLDAALAFARVWTPPTHTTYRNDGDVYTRIDPRTGEPPEDGVQQALPVALSWLDKLRIQRERLLEAGDMAGMAQADAVIRDEEARATGGAPIADMSPDEARAELDALRARQAP